MNFFSYCGRYKNNCKRSEVIVNKNNKLKYIILLWKYIMRYLGSIFSASVSDEPSPRIKPNKRHQKNSYISPDTSDKRNVVFSVVISQNLILTRPCKRKIIWKALFCIISPVLLFFVWKHWGANETYESSYLSDVRNIIKHDPSISVFELVFLFYLFSCFLFN